MVYSNEEIELTLNFYSIAEYYGVARPLHTVK